MWRLFETGVSVGIYGDLVLLDNTWAHAFTFSVVGPLIGRVLRFLLLGILYAGFFWGWMSNSPHVGKFMHPLVRMSGNKNYFGTFHHKGPANFPHCTFVYRHYVREKM